MSGSCHIGSVEIVVELGIFVFFEFSAEKSCDQTLHFGTPSSYNNLYLTQIVITL
jgi:hypothetical protein